LQESDFGCWLAVEQGEAPALPGVETVNPFILIYFFGFDASWGCWLKLASGPYIDPDLLTGEGIGVVTPVDR